MRSSEVRQKYIEFFKQRGHAEIPSAKLVPDNDPTTLFITAGMQPLIPYLLGEVHPEGKRLVDAQKSLRTDDIGEVGDNTHHSFFEMLGNWSLGDYFKKEAIEWSYEFLTSPEWLNIPKEKLAVSVFAGDEDAPFDEESYNIWFELGIPSERIAKLPKKNNWWGPAGQTGPCGPDTEMFYWASKNTSPVKFDPENPNWVEIWNDVFMQYFKKEDGGFELLKQQNVDTGMGLERTVAVLSGTPDNYKTDLFIPLIERIEQKTGTAYKGSETSYRIIADHIKASVFLIKDGVVPSNKVQGYVLRRLIRKAGTKMHELSEGSDTLLSELVQIVIDIYSDTNYFIDADLNSIKNTIQDEVKRSQKSIAEGFKEHQRRYESRFPKLTDENAREFMALTLKNLNSNPDNFLSNLPFSYNSLASVAAGTAAFSLASTHGLPVETFESIIEKKGWVENLDKSDLEGTAKTLQTIHQELSQTSSAGMFKGGLADHSEETTKLHTATHLLQAAAKEILGKNVGQRGSHITSERLRWDFNYDQKLTGEQIKQIEELVNEQINKNLKVWFDIEDRESAIKDGATTNFGENYPDKVKVYKMGNPPDPLFSVELCGGPHVEHTGVLKKFKIVKEESVSAGVRRIYAMIEK